MIYCFSSKKNVILFHVTLISMMYSVMYSCYALTSGVLIPKPQDITEWYD